MLKRRSLAGFLALPFGAVFHKNAHGAELDPSGKPPAPQMLARTLRDGWGVCGQPGDGASADAYAGMMDQIGTRDIRGHLVQYDASAAGRFTALQQAMKARGSVRPDLQVTTLVTAYLNDPTTWAKQQQPLLAFAQTGLLRAIEGPNEINNRVAGNGSHGPGDTADRTGPDDSPANFLAWAQALDRFRKANMAVLAGVSLVAPSIASGLITEYASLPNVSAFVDAGNVHFYAGGGRQPSYSIAPNPVVGAFANVLGWAKSAEVPNKPVWMTECGATTSNVYARGGVSQAKYLANQLFGFFAAGGQRLFLYQLIDGSGEPGDSEGNFGLFRRDGTPKPAVALLSRLKHLLSLGSYDDPRNNHDTAPFTPAYDSRSLTLGGSASPPGWQVLVMPKSDRSTLIAVWDEPMIDDGGGKDVTPNAQPVTVGFGSPQSYVVHDLLRDAASAKGTGASVTLPLQGYPMVIELLPPPQP